MSNLLEDLRFGFRFLKRRPGPTCIAIATLAMGVGATTSVFAVANALFLRPLPYRDDGHLVEIVESASQGWTMPVDYPNFLAWRTRTRSLESAAVFQTRALNFTGSDRPEQLPSANVSASFFSTLGVQPAIGRGFLPEEDRRNAPRVAVLSHAVWQDRFGSDRSIVGRTLRFSGRPHTVVGVLPSMFRFYHAVDVFVPFESNADEIVFRPGSRDNTIVIARLRAGASPRIAQDELRSLYTALERKSPSTNRGVRALATPLRERIAGGAKKPVFVLLAAVGLLFVISLANVTALVLAQSLGRVKEIAVRSAIGAVRGRIYRQFLIESLILSLAAALAGILISKWSVEAMGQLIPPNLMMSGLTIDARVLTFTLIVSAAAAALFGVAVAHKLTSESIAEALQNARAVGPSRSQQRAGRILVTTEVALASILLAGAGLMIRSYVALVRVDPGVRASDALTMRLNLPDGKYGRQPAFVLFWQRVLQRVHELPGVQAAGFTTSLPLSGSSQRMGVLLRGRPAAALADAAYHAVSPGYFRAIGIPLLRGRLPSESDTASSEPVVVISHSMAQRYWHGEDPVGTQIHMGPLTVDSPWMKVIGGVGDTRHYGLNRTPEPEYYFSALQLGPWTSPVLVVRTSRDAAASAESVRSAVAEVDKEQPVVEVKTMQEYLNSSLADRRSNTLLLGIFAAAAVLLATVGIYGVVSNSVTRRRREIGIRVALGATRAGVQRSLMWKEARPALLGVVLGIAGSLALTRLLASMLFGLSPRDIPTLAATAFVTSAVALAAAYLPARRAARADPLSALRCE